MEHEITVNAEQFQRLNETNEMEAFLKHNGFEYFGRDNNIPRGCLVFRPDRDGKVSIIQGI